MLAGLLYALALAAVAMTISAVHDAADPDSGLPEENVFGVVAIAGGGLVCLVLLVLAGVGLRLAVAHQDRLNAEHPDLRPRGTTAASIVGAVAIFAIPAVFFVGVFGV